MYKSFIIMFIVVLLLSGCTKSENPPIVVEPEMPDKEIPEIDPIEALIKEMSLEEKIGQLLIIGLKGTEISEIDKKHIIDNKVGGFIFFSRNIDNKGQVLKLLNSLKEINKENELPLFLSIDEEGGMVSRLTKIYDNLPNASLLGEKDVEELSFQYGENLGMKLGSLGFNVDFAPIMDINSNPQNPVIGERAFGNTADIVVKHGLNVIKGIKSQDIIPVAKHFPGHGDTDTDSHLNLPRIDKSYSELEDLELIPFKAAIDNGIDMIMVAHILFPKIDESVPATLSNVIMRDILREKLGFEGVVISDDMTMGAIANNYSIEEASVKFLINGGDIILVCHGSENPRLVIDTIKVSIEKGEISMEEIDKKLYRIIQLKNKYNLEDKHIKEIDIEEVNNMTIELNNKLK